MKKLNVWLITIGENLPIEDNVRKLRTAILADKLVNKGHNVLWWTSSFNHFNKNWTWKKDTEYTVNDNLKLLALKGIGYKKYISFSRFIDHRIIAWKFNKYAPKYKHPDIIIVSMPPHDLAFQAVKFAKKNNIPILVDIRDAWPDIFLEHMPGYFKNLAKIALLRDFQMIKEVMKGADGLLAIANTYLVWGLNYAKREMTWKDKVFYLGSLNNPEDNVKTKVNFEFTQRLRDKFVVVFIGSFAAYHNPSILLECAAKSNNKNICFVLAGDGELFNNFKIQADKLPNVILLGWLKQNAINELLRHSHVGICPNPQSADFFPNKAFLYLSAGLPVISSFTGDLKEVIEKYKIGVHCSSNNADELLKAVETLHKDTLLYNKMSNNARKIFAEMFDANKIYTGYAEHIENVFNNYKSGEINDKTFV